MPKHVATRRRALLIGALAVSFFVGGAAEGRKRPRKGAHAEPTPATSTSASSTAASAAEPPTGAPAASASSEPSGHVADPANREKPPLSSDDLTERASHLFDAISRGEPALADDFFFPLEPFVPLKDVADAARYHRQLVATYHRDVLDLHKRHASWDGASFVSFTLGTPPKWVAPGEEWNKIGYFRTFRGTLAYDLAGKRRTLPVVTIISWDGRWYVTHLAPIKH